MKGTSPCHVQDSSLSSMYINSASIKGTGPRHVQDSFNGQFQAPYVRDMHQKE